jgi:hypothetical protein
MSQTKPICPSHFRRGAARQKITDELRWGEVNSDTMTKICCAGFKEYFVLKKGK